MYKRIDFSQLEGLGVTQDTFDFLQTSYRDAFAGLSLFLGDFVIVSGVTVQGANYSDGWVAINGELLPFTGGLIAPNIIIEETNASEVFGDGSNKTVYFTRRAKLSNSGGNPISSFVRLKTAKVITTELAQAIIDIASTLANANSRVAKAGDTMTGNLVIPNATQNNHAANLGQVYAVRDALINGAPGALDALNELAAALGNDPNFAASMATALGQRVLKTGDTMTGPLSIPNGTDPGHAVNKSQLDAFSPVVKLLASELILPTVQSGQTASISEADLPGCKIGFWCNVHIDATNAGDIGNLAYKLDAGFNFLFQSDPGFGSNFNGSNFSWFVPLPPGSIGTFGMGHFVGSTATAVIKITAYV